MPTLVHPGWISWDPTPELPVRNPRSVPLLWTLTCRVVFG